MPVHTRSQTAALEAKRSLSCSGTRTPRPGNGGQLKKKKSSRVKSKGVVSLKNDKREILGKGKTLRDAEGLQDNPKTTRVLSTLADVPLDVVQIVNNFTRDDYSDLLRVLAETYPRLHVKLTYVYEENTLYVMSPSGLHESVASTLGDIVSDFARAIGHDKDVHKLIIYMNKHIFYNAPHQAKDEGEMREGTPDFQLVMEINGGQQPYMDPKWIGEVAFTSSTSKARGNLKNIIAYKPSIDLAFLISIHESPKWEGPRTDNPSAQQLRAEPLVDNYRAFKPTVEGNGMGPVIFGGITWISIARITLEVYVRSPEDGTLTVDADLQSPYSARGLLHPTVSTEEVDRLLTDGSEALNLASLLTAIIESETGEPEYVEQIRQSKATLIVPWGSILRSVRTSVLATAHERYIKWHSIPGKRKRAPQAGPSAVSKKAKK